MSEPAELIHEGELEAPIPSKPLPQRCYLHLYRTTRGRLVAVLTDLSHRSNTLEEPSHYGLAITNGITAFVNAVLARFWKPGQGTVTFFEHINRTLAFGAPDARGPHSFDQVFPSDWNQINRTYARCTYNPSDQATVEAAIGQFLAWIDTLR